MLLSIIIPILNEEKYLLQLPDSIKKQSFKDFDIYYGPQKKIQK